MPTKKIAIVLFNLGGPDSLEAVKPFLFNLFNDKAIIGAPNPIRWCLAKFISGRRAPLAREIYSEMGGRSPILEETRKQADKLTSLLCSQGDQVEYKSFIAMRYWHPFTEGAVEAVKQYQPDEVVLLPLYPQFSTATTQSSLDRWKKCAKLAGLEVPTRAIGCYPINATFVASHVSLLKKSLEKLQGDAPCRVLFSAHGLPKKVIEKGDPYQWQVEQTVEAIVNNLDIDGLDYQVCYQSRVGPLEWIGPSTDDEITRAGHDKKSVVLVPVAFVSEHSETLVELDIEYGELAKEQGVTEYIRVPTLSCDDDFIKALAQMVTSSGKDGVVVNDSGKRLCPGGFEKCACASV